MIIITNIKNFIKNENAISEEFTSLPSLSIVMIGFAIFIILISNMYSAYNNRINSLDKYQTADFIVTKLTNPDSFIIKEGGVINLPLLKSSNDEINQLREKYRASGVDFIIRINYENTIVNIPNNADDLLLNTGERVAVTKHVGIYLNLAQTKPGTLTVITWGV